MSLALFRICFDAKQTPEMHVRIQPMEFSRILMHRACAQQPKTSC